jgi:hypothetical protein
MGVGICLADMIISQSVFHRRPAAGLPQTLYVTGNGMEDMHYMTAESPNGTYTNCGTMDNYPAWKRTTGKECYIRNLLAFGRYVIIISEPEEAGGWVWWFGPYVPTYLGNYSGDDATTTGDPTVSR